MDSKRKRMAITKINRNGRDYTALIVLDEQRKFTELSVFEPEDERILDQIVIARVDKVVSGIHAAFVHISPTQKAYLPLEHLEEAFFTKKLSNKKAICEGDELLVQVTKEAVKTKDPVVSARLTLTGRYCLLKPLDGKRAAEASDSKNIMQIPEEQRIVETSDTKRAAEASDSKSILAPEVKQAMKAPQVKLSISRKIKGEERKQLQQFGTDLLEKLCSYHTDTDDDAIVSSNTDGTSDYGTDTAFRKQASGFEILLRTNCLQASFEDLREDILSIIRQWESICAKAPHQCAYSLLNAPLTGYIRQMQSLSYDDIDFVYTDDKAIYKDVKESLPYLQNQGKLVYYQDAGMPLSVLYHIEGNMDSLTSKRVWLPSGGNLIIEQVETMTVIDVNSAKSSANREAMLKANLEAAVEIPRQLRLRNISGMIIVDFINMDEEADKEEQFLSLLKKELRKDTVPANFIDITKLGLVEITRKKIRRSLKEIFSAS